MSLYVILSSNSSTDYYPNNTSYKFRSHLKTPLILTGKWKVALIDAYISSSHTTTDLLYISSNICEESIVEGEKQPFLRRLASNKPGQWNTVIQSPLYMSVKNREINDIELNIYTSTGTLASFLDKPSSITLHFKAFPFI